MVSISREELRKIFCKMQWRVKSEIIRILCVIKGLGCKTWLSYLIIPITAKKKRPIVIIRSDQSLSRVRLFVTPWIAARRASLSITNSRSSLRLTSIESVMPSSHLILCRPLLLLPPIPPSIRVFSNESTLHMRWPKLIKQLLDACRKNWWLFIGESLSEHGIFYWFFNLFTFFSLNHFCKKFKNKYIRYK